MLAQFLSEGEADVPALQRTLEQLKEEATQRRLEHCERMREILSRIEAAQRRVQQLQAQCEAGEEKVRAHREELVELLGSLGQMSKMEDEVRPEVQPEDEMQEDDLF